MLLHRFTAAPPKDVASPTPPTSQLLLSDSCLSILKHHGVIASATHHWMSLAYTYRGLGMESGGSALRPKLSFLHVVSPSFACRSASFACRVSDLCVPCLRPLHAGPGIDQLPSWCTCGENGLRSRLGLPV